MVKDKKTKWEKARNQTSAPPELDGNKHEGSGRGSKKAIQEFIDALNAFSFPVS